MHIYVHKGIFFTKIFRFPVLNAAEYFKMSDIKVIKLWICNIKICMYIYVLCRYKFDFNIIYIWKNVAIIYLYSTSFIYIYPKIKRFCHFDLILDFNIAVRVTIDHWPFIVSFAAPPSLRITARIGLAWNRPESPSTSGPSMYRPYLRPSLPSGPPRRPTIAAPSIMWWVLYFPSSRYYEVNAPEYYTGR